MHHENGEQNEKLLLCCIGSIGSIFAVHCRNLTYPPKIMVGKMIFLLQRVIFMCHVSFQEVTYVCLMFMVFMWGSRYNRAMDPSWGYRPNRSWGNSMEHAQLHKGWWKQPNHTSKKSWRRWPMKYVFFFVIKKASCPSQPRWRLWSFDDVMIIWSWSWFFFDEQDSDSEGKMTIGFCFADETPNRREIELPKPHPRSLLFQAFALHDPAPATWSVVWVQAKWYLRNSGSMYITSYLPTFGYLGESM